MMFKKKFPKKPHHFMIVTEVFRKQNAFRKPAGIEAPRNPHVAPIVH